MARVRIVLHGHLRKLAQPEFIVEATSARDAIEGLVKQSEQLRPAVGRQHQHVRVLGFDTVESLVAPLSVDELHLVPILAGGKSGFFQIALGIVLIAVAVWNPLGIAALSITQGVTVGSLLFGVGLSLVLGGIAQMLAPAPTIDTRSDPDASKVLPTQQNTVRIGTRIPLAYGRNKLYGHFLSFNVQSTDVVLTTLA